MKELTPKEIQNLLGYEVKMVTDKSDRRLADVPVGETFKVGDLEFIVLEHTNNNTNVILKDFWATDHFDDKTSNYAESRIRNTLNSVFYKKLVDAIGKENIVRHTIDLTTDDGRKDYGSVYDNISLLTCDMYRKYVTILDKYNPKKWWWLATSYSTASNGYNLNVRCVYFGGSLFDSCCNNNYGVRPFCILKSDIFVF